WVPPISIVPPRSWPAYRSIARRARQRPDLARLLLSENGLRPTLAEGMGWIVAEFHAKRLIEPVHPRSLPPVRLSAPGGSKIRRRDEPARARPPSPVWRRSRWLRSGSSRLSAPGLRDPDRAVRTPARRGNAGDRARQRPCHPPPARARRRSARRRRAR